MVVSHDEPHHTEVGMLPLTYRKPIAQMQGGNNLSQGYHMELYLLVIFVELPKV